MAGSGGGTIRPRRLPGFPVRKLTMPFLKLAAVFAGLARLSAADCLPLPIGHTLQAMLGRGLHGCVEFRVQPNQPVRLAVDQPVDLELRLTEGGSPAIVDGFEFGFETKTLLAPGTYRVELRTVLDPPATPVPVHVSLHPVPVQPAVEWAEAESRATRAKRSGNAEELAASLANWEKLKEPAAIGRTRLLLGDVHSSRALYVEARADYEAGLAVCRTIQDVRCAGEAANNSGLASEQLGDFEPALARLTEAATFFRPLTDREPEALAIDNLGVLFWRTADYQKAIVYFVQASNLFRDRISITGARTIHNLGLCYQSLAEYDQARVYFGRARQQFLQLQDRLNALCARVNLGRNYLLEGRTEEARKLLDDALAEAAPGDRSLRADIQGLRGQTMLAAGRAEEAQALLDQALESHRALGDRRMEAVDLHHLGLCAAQRGEIASARQYLNQALAIRRACGLRDTMTDTLAAMAALERSAGNAATARELAEQALTVLESVRVQVPGAALRAAFYARKRRLFDLLVDLAAGPGSPDAAAGSFLAAERVRGRALLDVLTEGRLTGNVPPELLDQRKQIQRQIDLLSVRAAAAPAEKIAGLERQVELLTGRDEAIDAEIRQAAGGSQTVRPVQSLEELRGYLPADAALLEFHLGEERSYVWLVDSGGIRMFPLPPRPEVEAQAAPVVDLFGAILDRQRFPQKQRQFEGALRRLSATLLGPFRGIQLPARLILAPDGVLTRIPFAALELSPGNRLGLLHDLVQVSSASYLAVGRKPRRPEEFPRTILALADPVFSAADPRVSGKAAAGTGLPLPRLPFSGELDTVSTLVPAARRRLLTGFGANLEALRGARPGEFAILHFSTHAEIDDRTPELSRVLLSMLSASGQAVDGALRPHQFSQLSLNGSTVVLSACKTAAGKQVMGEGLAGFSASLFQAGAAQLVLTLSEVDAEASAEFFRQAYGQLLSARPVPVERAVTLARRKLAVSKRWSDPCFWASYVVMGRPAEPAGNLRQGL
jgi:CHAT domain-containing protein/Tfp pilus assembly protein PilF